MNCWLLAGLNEYVQLDSVVLIVVAGMLCVVISNNGVFTCSLSKTVYLLLPGNIYLAEKKKVCKNTAKK